MSRTFDELVELGEAKLSEVWRQGTPPSPDELAGWIFRGVNTSLMARRSPLAGAEFAKGFFWSGASLYGCNFPVAVDDGGWRLDEDHPFGFFQIYPTRHSNAWAGYPSALILDYGRGHGPQFLAEWGVELSAVLRITDRLARPLRDLVVRPPDAADGIFLGRAFVTSRLKLPVTCFVLERWQAFPYSAVADRSVEAFQFTAEGGR